MRKKNKSLTIRLTEEQEKGLQAMVDHLNANTPFKVDKTWLMMKFAELGWPQLCEQIPKMKKIPYEKIMGGTLKTALK